MTQDTTTAPRIAWTNDFAKPPSRPETLADGLRHLENRAEDFRRFMAFDRDRLEELQEIHSDEALDTLEASELTGLEELLDEYGDDLESKSIPDGYGLALDYQFSACGGAPGVVFLLSTGGGHEEVVFRMAPGDREPERVEFVWKDWGTGIGFDVTGEDWADWLWDRFSEQAPYLMRQAWEAADVQE